MSGTTAVPWRSPLAMVMQRVLLSLLMSMENVVSRSHGAAAVDRHGRTVDAPGPRIRVVDSWVAAGETVRIATLARHGSVHLGKVRRIIPTVHRSVFDPSDAADSRYGFM
jgi:hypothetical protein